jgi:hypothetical protein
MQICYHRFKHLLNCWGELNVDDNPVKNNSDTVTTIADAKKGQVPQLQCSLDGWIILMICRREVHPMEVVHVQLPPAVRALLISLDGCLDALLAEDVTTDGR